MRYIYGITIEKKMFGGQNAGQRNGFMEIVEEEEKLGAVGKTQHLKFSRKDTIVNDLKNSTVQGIISFLLSLAAVGLDIGAVYNAYTHAGKAGVFTGILMISAFLIAIVGVILAIRGLKNRKKIRHYMEWRGIVICGVVWIVTIALYIRGVQLYFN